MQTLIRTTLSLPLLALLLGSGCQHNQTTLRFYEQVSESLPPGHSRPVAFPKDGLRLNVDPYAALTERSVQSAELAPTAGGAAVLIHFDVHGTILLDELTTRDRGHYLVIMLNDTPTAAWLVQQRLSLGQFLLEGDFTDEQAKKLVESLNAIGRKQSAR